MDESFICHKNRKSNMVLGVVNNKTKEFRIEASYWTDTPTIKNFILKFIDKGNTIICDGWPSINF